MIPRRLIVLSAASMFSVCSFTTSVAAAPQMSAPVPGRVSRPGNAPGRMNLRAPVVRPEDASATLRLRRLRADVAPLGGADVTTEIAETARGLRNDPKLIYEFVKNTIEYVPIYGSIKGASATLLDGRGNDFDQSSLMIALLKAAGFSPTYIYGTIRLTAAQLDNWLGAGTDPDVMGALFGSAGIPATIFINPNGSLAYVDFAHAWVKVTISGTAYVFDPSYKTFTYSTGIDLKAAMGYDQTTFLDRATAGATVDADYVQNVNRGNIRADLASYATNLIGTIRATNPGAKLGEVIGGREIVLSRNESFRVSLPYERSRDQEFAEIPSAFDVLIRIQHLGIDVTLAASSTYGKRLTLFYNAANAPELRVDGTLLATGAAAAPGSYNAITLTCDHPYAAFGGSYADQTFTTSILSGSQYAIMNGFANPARGVLEKHRKAVQTELENGGAVDSEPVRGESLTVFSDTWLTQVSESEQRLDRVAKTITIQHHTLGFAGQVASPYVDIPMALVSEISIEENPAKEDAVFFVGAGISSAFEWGIFEQTQTHSAVCTVKLLDLSNGKGDKIFDASLANYYGSVKPQLVNYSPSELATVESYVNAGFRVTLPQDGDLNELSWTGIGFIAVSPAEDSIAHIIAGNLSGGFGTDPWGADPYVIILTGDPSYMPNLNAQSQEPIDLVTGQYLREHIDLTLGSQGFPIGLGFARSYNSAARATDGPLGRGWSHSFDGSARLDTDGLQGLGEDSPIDAAANLTELLVAQDILQGTKTNLRLVTATIAHRWFLQQLIDNVVTVTEGQSTRQFVKLPDGSYNAPPGMADQLTLEQDGSYLLRSKHGVIEDFGSDGKIVTWRDPNGNEIDYAYTGGKLESVSNSAGRSFALSYTGERITAVSDGTGRSVSYGYDGAGNLVTSTDPRGFVTTYEYDLPGRMTKVFPPSHPAVPSVINSYDALGRVATQTDAASQIYTYYFSGQRAEEVDPTGASHVMYFDRRGRTVIDINAVGNERTLTYDGQGRLIRNTYPEGNSVEYQYDAGSNITRMAVNPKPPSGSPALVKTFTYEGTFNRLLTSKDELNRTTDYTYDALGNLIKVEQPAVNAQRPTASYTYNARGQVLTLTDPMGIVRRFAYDPGTGERVQVIDDDAGLHHVTSFGYDAVGNLVQQTDALDRTVTSQFDDARRLVQSIAPAPFSYVTNRSWDEDGNLERIERQTGDLSNPWQVTAYTYTPTFKVATHTDPQGHVTAYQYDGADRLLGITDALSHVTQYQYDLAGRLTKVIDARNLTKEQHAYTTNGQKLTLKDANGNTTTFAYDEYDRLRKITFPGGSFEQYTYDATSNIVTKRTRAAGLFNYSYDALNRLTQKVAPNPGGGTTQYTYDLDNRLVDVIDAGGVIHHDYDRLGRPVQVTHADGKTVGYGYDALANRTSLTYPDGYLVTYGYDALDRLTDVKESGATLLAHFDYDPLSRRVQTTYGNGATTSYTWEIDNDLIGVTHQWNGGSLPLAYTFDPIRNKVSFTDGARSEVYAYDAISQLTQFSSNASPALVDYVLDAPGNRSSVTEDANTTSYSVNSLNEYTSVGGVSYTYDANGNLTADASRTFLYNSQSWLTGVTTPQNQASYSYDAMGRRIGKLVTPIPPPTHESERTHNEPAVGTPPPVPTDTRYVHDRNQVLAEYDGASGALLRRYVYGAGLDEPLVLMAGGATYYYHQDGLGSVVALTGAAGQEVESYHYDPYGRPTGARVIGNAYLFASRTFDEETGLYYNRARYYEPRIGRFLQADPSGYMDGLNLYAYAGNDPVNFVDPLGLSKEKSWWDKLWEGRYFGTGYGEEALQFYADKYVESGNPLWAIPGFFAALWTPETWDKTAAVLTLGLSLEGTLAKAAATEIGEARVFWSGGEAAKDAAAAWAESNGAVTLEMTANGARLAETTEGLDWLTQARPMWASASEEFASGAAGEVHVFQNGAGVSLQSIWRTVEYPSLMNNPNVSRIIYHVIMPNGQVIIVP